MTQIIKRDGHLVDFDKEKIIAELDKCLDKQ